MNGRGVEGLEIDLKELAAALEKAVLLQGYVDTQNGDVVFLGDIPEISPASDGEDAAREEACMEHVLSIEDDWQRYVPLPDLYEGEIRAIMQAFADNAPQPVRKEMQEVLHGSAARTRFRKFLRECRMEEAWQEHLAVSLRVLAREWCEENRIAYRE